MGEDLFRDLDVVASLPRGLHTPTGGEDIVSRLTGAKIVRFGSCNERIAELEGGGLIIDFVPEGGADVERVIFALAGNGMWAVYGPSFLIPGKDKAAKSG
ncbi:MAG: hypothetical protein ABJP87_15555 [Bauldia litoralis]|uniref:hypothetical protein n=1 Tax=Bauldia litoralis TaxID=665467 RepID=UPI003299112B